MPPARATSARLPSHKGFLFEPRRVRIELRTLADTAPSWRARLQFLDCLPLGTISRHPGTGVFIGAEGEIDANAFLRFVVSKKFLPQHVVFVSMQVEPVPTVPLLEQPELVALGHGIRLIVVHYGFNDEADIPKTLRCVPALDLDAPTTHYHVGASARRHAGRGEMPAWRQWLFVTMGRAGIPAAEYFHLPPDRTTQIVAGKRTVR
jgi:KUP system potassium uptake protein